MIIDVGFDKLSNKRVCKKWTDLTLFFVAFLIIGKVKPSPEEVLRQGVIQETVMYDSLFIE